MEDHHADDNDVQDAECIGVVSADTRPLYEVPHPVDLEEAVRSQERVVPAEQEEESIGGQNGEEVEQE